MFKYVKSIKYDRLMGKIMGPNPVKLCEELLVKSDVKKAREHQRSRAFAIS